MITSGEIKAFDMITTGTETTTEYMRTCIKSFVDTFCEIAGNLQIIESKTEEHEKGVFYYIGEKGSNYPLFCIGNTIHTSYYYRYLFIGFIKRDGEPNFSRNATSSQSGCITLELTNIKYYVSYIKSDINFLFGFRDKNGKMVYNAAVTQVQNGNEKKTGFVFIENYVYASLIPGFANTGGLVSLPYCNTLRNLCPVSKDAMFDIFIGGEEKLVSLKLFTNRARANPGKMQIGEKTYVTTTYSNDSYPYIIAEIE